MALHNRRYYRIQRKKHINRKKRIIRELHNYWNYAHDGELNKGKIHCSCPLCRAKTKDKILGRNWKHSDRQKQESMNTAVAEYWQNESSPKEL